MDQHNVATAGEPLQKGQFKQIDGIAYEEIGKAPFASAHAELLMMMRGDLEDISDATVQNAKESVGGWHL